MDGLGRRVVRNLPQLGHVLEGHHKAAARRGVVHRRHARGLLAIERGGGVVAHQVQVGIEQHGVARQVVGRHHPAAIAAHRHVAHVQARTHLGHDAKAPQVVLGDPAIARAKEHIAPVGRELGATVQCVAAGKTGDDFKLVAIEQRNMVVAPLHHQEQVHGVGRPHGLGGLIGRCGGGHARCANVVIAPGGRGLHRAAHPLRQGLDFGGAQRASKAGHLRGGAALANHAQHLGGAHALQAFGQQGRAHGAGALGRVARGAVLLVQGRSIRHRSGGGGGRRSLRQRGP